MRRIARFSVVVLLGSAVVSAAESLPEKLQLIRGELRSVAVEELTRVAVGDPKIADVSVVSTEELLLQAKDTGTTYLVVWDHRGRSTIEIGVVDRSPEERAQQLRRLLDQLQLTEAQVKQEGTTLFIVGRVPTEADRDRIDQILTVFPGVANIVTVPPSAPPPPPGPLPLVQLAVQVVELNRTDLEKLGVNWSSSITATDPATTDQTWKDLLFRWGTSLSRSKVEATLNALVTQNRGRILAEPKLVTASGKTAESFLGGEVPILSTSTTGVGTGTVSTQIVFKNFGVTLKMTPTVDPVTTKITTALEAEVSGIDTSTSITVSGVTVPGFKTRKAQTEIVTDSGETIVVAGLLQSEDSKAVSQVPALGSVPVIGRLFRSPEFQTKQTELVIAVTPQLLADEAETADRTMALEQALASAEVASAVEDPKLRYALQIQDRIAKALRYPQREKELGMEGRVKLRLHVFADGTIGRAMVAESSGVDALDAEALKAAESQAPYPPFPSQLAAQDVWLDIPVIFRP